MIELITLIKMRKKHNGINPLADHERSVRKYYEIQRKLRGNYEGVEKKGVEKKGVEKKGVERGNEW